MIKLEVAKNVKRKKVGEQSNHLFIMCVQPWQVQPDKP